jgi:hypothetical protein
MTGSNTRTSRNPLFDSFGSLTLSSQYILSIVTFLLQNKQTYVSDSSVHEFNSRHKLKLYKPTVNFTICRKGVYYGNIELLTNYQKSMVNLT